MKTAVAARDASSSNEAGPRPVERDYVLGTHDRETERLGIQHAAWRPIVLDCWRRAGISSGDTVIDVGAGPGYAALDLAEIVGPSGRVVAVERSARFVEAGLSAVRETGLSNVTYVEADLMTDPFPAGPHDAAWCRWVASFVESPAVMIEKIAGGLRTGGTAVFHEYVDYASWRFSPRLPLVEEYIARVMGTWREAGGEPDVAMDLLALLRRNGFDVRHVEPRVFCVPADHRLWTWIATFVESNLDHLRDTGGGDPAWVEDVRSEFRAAQTEAGTMMLTPMLLEVIAVKTA